VPTDPFQQRQPLLRQIVGSGELLRLRLLGALLKGEWSVTELTQATGRQQPTVSKHLAVLRTEGLVTTRREQNRVFYRIASDRPAGQALRALLESQERALLSSDQYK
jgi:DNA-binding transcriptional ArsR family regulator